MQILEEYKVDNRYSGIIWNIFENVKMIIKLHAAIRKNQIKWRVIQGDTLSLKLFTIVVKRIFRS